MTDNTTKHTPSGEELLVIVADGLDAAQDGRGWNEKHQAARDTIVRAVNSRAALVGALERGYILALVDRSPRRFSMAGQADLCKMRDALADATGQTSQEIQERCEDAALALARGDT